MRGRREARSVLRLVPLPRRPYQEEKGSFLVLIASPQVDGRRGGAKLGGRAFEDWGEEEMGLDLAHLPFFSLSPHDFLFRSWGREGDLQVCCLNWGSAIVQFLGSWLMES